MSNESPSVNQDQDYRPQLDGLRAFAVMLVLFHHWTEWGLGLGHIGVQLFFVLSGFLITSILLGIKDAIKSGERLLVFSLRQFYMRRFLRIFPLYYACLLLFVIIDRFEIRETAPWHFLYLSNVLFFIKGAFEGPFSHFWTLSVEEQFYIFWPVLALLIPRSRLPIAILIMVILGPLTRVAIWLFGGHEFAQHSILLPANLDTLGLGALGALWRMDPGGPPNWARSTARWLVPLCFTEVILARVGGNGFSIYLLDSLAVAVLSLWFVWRASQGFNGVASTLLENPLVRYLGKISYGLYVWHMFAPAFLRNILKFGGFPDVWNHGIIGFSLMFSITVGAATASWFILENPINRLKIYFPYREESRKINHR